MVSNVQRTEIESKSQLNEYAFNNNLSWYQMYKELKLKANHNTGIFFSCAYFVGIKCTKNWNWKQITTGSGHGGGKEELVSNVQRTEIESKSQLTISNGRFKFCWYQMYKELKLKANHNSGGTITTTGTVGIKCTKNWNWKQITTSII